MLKIRNIKIYTEFEFNVQFYFKKRAYKLNILKYSLFIIDRSIKLSFINNKFLYCNISIFFLHLICFSLTVVVRVIQSLRK